MPQQITQRNAQTLLNNTMKSINQLKEQGTDQNKEQLGQLQALADYVKASYNVKDPTTAQLERAYGLPEFSRKNLPGRFSFSTGGQPKWAGEWPGAVQPMTPIRKAEKQQEERVAREAAPRGQETRAAKAAKTGRITPPRTTPGIEGGKEIPVSRLSELRRGIQRARYDLAKAMEGLPSGQKLNMLKAQDDEYARAYSQVLDREKQAYANRPDAAPADWSTEKDAPKELTGDQILKQDPIKLNEIPESLTFAQEAYEPKKFAKEPGDIKDIEGKKGVQGRRFINQQLRKNTNDLIEKRAEIDRLDRKIPEERAQIDNLMKDIDDIKKSLNYYDKIKNEGVENKWLSDEYRALDKQLREYLTPEQRQAVKEGKEIDINKIPNKNAFLRGLQELGRTKDQVLQSAADERLWLEHDPNNSIQDYRSLPQEDRRDLLNDIKKERFLRDVAEGTPEYYNKNKKEGQPTWEQIPPEEQQQWTKKYAADRARAGAPGMSGNDIYKFMFGGGEQFYSKYPPELYNKMIGAARQGFGRQQQAGAGLQRLTQGSPMEQVFGKEAAPSLQQLMLGVAPEEGQPFEQAPYQPTIQSPHPQYASPGLSQLLGQQYAGPNPDNVAAVDSLIQNKLGNLTGGQ